MTVDACPWSYPASLGLACARGFKLKHRRHQSHCRCTTVQPLRRQPAHLDKAIICVETGAHLRPTPSNNYPACHPPSRPETSCPSLPLTTQTCMSKTVRATRSHGQQSRNSDGSALVRQRQPNPASAVLLALSVSVRGCLHKMSHLCSTRSRPWCQSAPHQRPPSILETVHPQASMLSLYVPTCSVLQLRYCLSFVAHLPAQRPGLVSFQVWGYRST